LHFRKTLLTDSFTAATEVLKLSLFDIICTHRQTYRQTYKQTNKQTDRCSDIKTESRHFTTV